MKLPFLAVALCALAQVAHAADLEGRVRLSSGTGVDTNVLRDYTPSQGTAAAANAENARPVTDGMVSLSGAAEGSATFESARLLGSYDGGYRRFLLYPEQSAFIQAAQGEAGYAVGRTVGVGVQGQGRDRRGGARDYSDLSGSVFLDFVPDNTLSFRVWGGGHRFIYWPAFNYSYAATELGTSLRYRLDKRNTLLVFGELGSRNYTSAREDSAVEVGGGWSWKGPFTLGLSYAFSQVDSNTRGESWQRHRLSGTAGFKLPWQTWFFTQLTVQRTWLDGVFLSPDVESLSEDTENHNAASFRLVRPLGANLDAELRYAVYQSSLPENGMDYFRQVGWMGLTWRL